MPTRQARALLATSRTGTIAGPTTRLIPSQAGPLTTCERLGQPATTSIQPERRLPLPSAPRGRDGRGQDHPSWYNDEALDRLPARCRSQTPGTVVGQDPRSPTVTATTAPHKLRQSPPTSPGRARGGLGWEPL